MSSHPFQSLPVRIAVAAVAIPVILWLTWMGGYWFFGFIVLLSSLSLYEFYVLLEKKGGRPLKTVGLAGGALLTGAFLYDRVQGDLFRLLESWGLRLAMFSMDQYVLALVLLLTVLILLIELFRTEGSPFFNAGGTVLGLLMIPLFFGTLVGLREVFVFGFPAHLFVSDTHPLGPDAATRDWWGAATVMGLFATIWICDTAAYFTGLSIGRHRLFERVSPKKTWEGAVAGFLASVATMIVLQQSVLGYLSVQHAAVIGVLIGVFGQLGDLVESRFKRDVGVKDSSALIPGHGGAYDRFDSVVFVSPVVYLYVDFVVLS